MEYLKPHPDPEQAAHDKGVFESLLMMRCLFPNDEAFFRDGFETIMLCSHVLEALLDMGGDINMRLNLGRTLLARAAFYIHPEVVALTLERGANANIIDEFGRTALDSALLDTTEPNTLLAEQGVVCMLLRHGAVRNKKEPYDNPYLVSFCQSIRAVTILCSPLVIRRLYKGTWLPVELIRELHNFL